jgi:hypothetical protein
VSFNGRSATIPFGSQLIRDQVTLFGEVDWDLDREAAEQTVRKLSGVIGVTNLLTTKGCAVRHAQE